MVRGRNGLRAGVCVLKKRVVRRGRYRADDDDDFAACRRQGKWGTQGLRIKRLAQKALHSHDPDRRVWLLDLIRGWIAAAREARLFE